MRKKNHLLEQQEEELNLSKQLIEEKEVELAEVTKELVLTEHKNELLQRSIEMMDQEHSRYKVLPLFCMILTNNFSSMQLSAIGRTVNLGNYHRRTSMDWLMHNKYYLT